VLNEYYKTRHGKIPVIATRPVNIGFYGQCERVSWEKTNNSYLPAETRQHRAEPGSQGACYPVAA
jgi:hypothetical protein